MGTVGLALVVGGMALLFGGLVFSHPVRAKRSPQEPFEDSQERIEHYLRETSKKTQRN